MKKALIYILGFLLFVSCKDEQEDIFLLVEKSNVTFLSASGAETISVSTNGKFTAVSSSEWCTVTPAGSQLKVSVTENVALQERTSIITISAEGAAHTQVNVKQAGTDSFFTIDKGDGAFTGPCVGKAFIKRDVARVLAQSPDINGVLALCSCDDRVGIDFVFDVDGCCFFHMFE